MIISSIHTPNIHENSGNHKLTRHEPKHYQFPAFFSRLLFFIGFSTLCSNQIFAHAPEQSYVYLTIDDHAVSGRVEITHRDLNTLFGLDWPERMRVEQHQIDQVKDRVNDYVEQRLGFSINDEKKTINIVDHSTLSVTFAKFLRVHFELSEINEMPKYIDITNNLIFNDMPNHQSLLVIENNWKTGTYNNEAMVSLTFTPDTTQQRLDLSDGSTLNALWGLIKMGLHHILIGADHILFLIALLIPSVMSFKSSHWQGNNSFKSAFVRIVKIVTVFTIAHSITLSLSALDIIFIPSRIVESVIAFSIAAAAIHIILPRFLTHSLWLVLVFGLFHGIGFASVLKELEFPQHFMFESLLGFNIGVELGQLAIVCAVIPVLFMFRNEKFYSRFVMPVASIGLIAISIYWFIERAFDLDFRVGSTLKSIVGI